MEDDGMNAEVGHIYENTASICLVCKQPTLECIPYLGEDSETYYVFVHERCRPAARLMTVEQFERLAVGRSKAAFPWHMFSNTPEIVA